MTRPLVALALLLALTGCAAPAVTGPAVAPAPDASAAAMAPAPVAVSIPAIGASSPLVPLGLDEDGALAVPPLDQPMLAGWYEPGVSPGERGPAVIAGHVSGRVEDRPVLGVFARLSEVAPGDEVIVDRYDAPPLRWTITRVGSYPKDQFPTEAVWGDTHGPELRLVTCGGVLETLPDGTRSYDSNVVAFAVPA